MCSMTGFGSADSGDATIAIRSVNHRFLDLSINLPRRFQALEGDLRSLVKARLRRGKVELTLRVGNGDRRGGELTLSPSLAASAVKALSELKETFHLSGEVTLTDVVRVPGVFEVFESEDGIPEARKREILAAAQKALEGLENVRRAEGEALSRDLLRSLKEIESGRERITRLSEEGKASRKEGLRERSRELLDELGLDTQRAYQEIVRLIDRQDISEEVERLRSHLQQTEKTVQEGAAAGKRLDFFAQELMREANTVGSKASDAALVHEVVSLKESIERFREQVQNVE